MFALLAPTVGCGFVGLHYRYGGREYTMTKPNIDYHENAVREVRRQFGDPESLHDVAALKGACELLRRYAAEAPEPGQFTPARELLDHEARTTCNSWNHLVREEEAKADHARREAERNSERARHEQQRDAERNNQERARLIASLQRDTRTLEVCDRTESTRAARKRHHEMLDKGPGAQIRKQCSPRMETAQTRTECKDDNGFTKPCTKTVSTGEVAGYACPKTMDQELVQLGLYQLQLIDYPFPEEHSIGVRDSECDEARMRSTSTKEKLEALGKAVTL